MSEWQLSESFVEQIKAISGAYNLREMTTDMVVADSSRKYMLESGSGQPDQFLLVANIKNGDIVGVAAKNAEKLHKLLSPSLAKRVLKPTHHGEFDGFSYAIYELCKPLTDIKVFAKLQNSNVFGQLVSWHQKVTEETIKPVQAQHKSRIILQMSELVSCFAQQPSIQVKVSRVLDVLNAGDHSPLKTSVAHTDLWRGNVMWSSSKDKDFRVIDWGGMSLHSNPFFDLSRLILSFRPRASRAKDSMQTYQKIMGCDSREVMIYFYISMADLLENLDNFPIERFRELVGDCDSILEKVIK